MKEVASEMRARPGVHRLAGGGWELAVVSDRAAAVTVELYAEGDPERPIHRQPLVAATADLGAAGSAVLWSCRLPEELVARARYYAYRVAGPPEGLEGSARFDPAKPLLDPYARRLYFPPRFSRAAARRPGEETAGRAPLAVLPRAAPSAEPRPAVQPPPAHDLGQLVVYELHVDAFTRRDPRVAAERRGSYLGLIDKIDYLRELGVTAVELMPVFQWDPQEDNYWGYMPLAFFAAEPRFAASADPSAELAAAIAALHSAGIEVWLDVVYNHTAEGDETGPTYSFRGLDDAGYYLVEPPESPDPAGAADPAAPADPTAQGAPAPGRYRNDSGTGNVFAAARPAPRRLVLDSLRHWTERIGVAGCRFDLATLLARDAEGEIESPSRLLAEIEALADERGVRRVAEPWDLGAYRLGETFPGRRWWQWNGRFRDSVRAFVRGDSGLEREVALRLGGSPDLFPPAGGEWGPAGVPVNYVACHDGFNLWDLVSYDRKRNRANGWGDRDGPADDRSWNCGWEGDEGAPAEVLALRRRQARNLMCLLLLSSGIPMLLSGDEILHTRGGNNNPYNQDNETNWLDWERREKNAGFHRFVRRLIALRKAHPGLARPWAARAAWFAPDGPAGAEADPRSLAYHLPAAVTGAPAELFVAANASPEPRAYRLPAEGWRRVIDTGRAAPRDVLAFEDIAGEEMGDLELATRTVVVLRRSA